MSQISTRSITGQAWSGVVRSTLDQRMTVTEPDSDYNDIQSLVVRVVRGYRLHIVCVIHEVVSLYILTYCRLPLTTLTTDRRAQKNNQREPKTAG